MAKVAELLELVRHVGELAGDGGGKQADRGDDADGDDGQDDAVLGHRLTLLALRVRAGHVEPVAEIHAVTPPFGGIEGGEAEKLRMGCGHADRIPPTKLVACRY